MDSVNQTATCGVNLVGWVVNGWNTISPVIGNYLNQTGYVVSENISNRNASTIWEVVKQAGHFAMPLVKFSADKVVGLCKFTWSLAVAHPVIAISLALVFVVIPVLREYCAANEKFTFKALPVIAWMIITRPFRLAYRILTVITGGAEVEKQRLIAAKKENIETQRLLQENNELLRANNELLRQVNRL